MAHVFPAKVDFAPKLAFVAAYAVLAWAVFDFWDSGDYSIGGIVGMASLLLLAVLLPVFIFPGECVLGEDRLVVRCGVLRFSYKYSEIKSAELVDSPFSLSLIASLTLSYSFSMVHIAFNSGRMPITVSPGNRLEFFRELCEKSGCEAKSRHFRK